MVWPATASAGWRIERAQAIAAEVWHHPCGGKVEIRWQPMEKYAGLAAFGGCWVALTTVAKWTWTDLCTVMIHEYGHLARFVDWANTADPAHSLNPHSVMYATPADDPRCRDRGRPFLLRTALRARF